MHSSFGLFLVTLAIVQQSTVAAPTHEKLKFGAETVEQETAREEISNHHIHLSIQNAFGNSKSLLLDKTEQLFKEIIREAIQAEQANEAMHLDKKLDNIDNQLKSLLFMKMKAKYDKAMRVNMQHHHTTQQVTHSEMKFETELEEILDNFLAKKVSHAQNTMKEQPGYAQSRADTLSDYLHAHIMNNEYSYVPVYKFDNSSSEYCYPDSPSSENDFVCVTTLNPNAPVFYEVDNCDGLMVYTYWLWYGRQKTCIVDAVYSGHGNDWEDVSVYVNPRNGKVVKVVYHQHNGYYTRRRGTYEFEGERPVVYVGKIGHGSYHSHCNGQCSFSEFFTTGCVGSVTFCPGGCGYWDDFRNPGPELRDVQLYPLMEGQVVDGIKRPDRDVCGIGTCEGSSFRNLFTSGCWQNEP